MLSAKIGQVKHFNNENGVELLSISTDAFVAQAAEIMSQHHIGCLAVFDSKKNYVGIISERDMISKVLAKSLSPDKVLVKDIMTSSIISCDINSTVAEVEGLMAEHRIRHLPVMKDNSIIGMISTRDLIEYRLASNKAMQAAAEQLALLPAGLKSLDFEDVVSLALNEVPKSFGSERAVLCFKTPGANLPMIYRNTCQSPHENLMETLPKDSDNLNENITVNPCSNCTLDENSCEKYIIPLSINDQSKDGGEQRIIPGFLCMCCFNKPASAFDESQKYKATLLQQILSANFTNAKLYMNYQNARQDSETDPLTGVSTRRVLEKALKAECARATRYNRVFSIAIVDLDKFKQINDTAGHAAGDKTLKQLAKLLKKNARNTDTTITRFGGDEFVLVIPETPAKGAKVYLERVRRQLRSISIPGIEHVTISCGIAEWNKSPQDTPESIMTRADEALYEAKETGRNKVVTHSLAEVKC